MILYLTNPGYLALSQPLSLNTLDLITVSYTPFRYYFGIQRLSS